MARPRAIRPEELTMLTEFRVKIVNWEKYQVGKDGKPVKGKQDWVKLKAASTTDTINEEKLEVRGLLFDMLRHSAGGRKPGYLVAGSGEPLTLSRLARFMFVKLEELLPPLKRLMVTDRLKLLVATSEGSDEEPEKTEPEKTEPEKTEPEKTEPSEKVKLYRACRVFWLAWEELISKSYGRQYDKTQWDETNLQKVLKPENLHRYIAYAFHFHQQDSKVGIPKLEEKETSKLKAPTLDNFLKRVSDYSSGLRGKEWAMSQKWSTGFLTKHQSQK